MIIHRFATVASVAVLFGLVGCGGGPNLAEVEGTLKLNGKPLDKIQVEFWPEGNGPRSMGTTDAQGRFTLMTDDGKRKGAVVGKHKIVLKDVGVLGDKFLGRAGEDVDMTKGKKPQISNAYSDPHKSPIQKEVTAGKCVIDIDLTSR
jgi:hypothetical protein